jgi:uncharacterized protein (TIGR02271 family)
MAQSNESTIIGVFDDYSTAQTVARELEGVGIPREKIQVRSNLATGAVGRGAAAGPSITVPTIDYFRDVLGPDSTAEEVGHYAEAVRRGSSVVAVRARADLEKRAVELMNLHGAADIDRRVKFFEKTGYRGYDASRPAYTTEEAARERERFRAEASAIPVVEEELQVGKRVLRHGGVRVYTHVVEKPVQEEVRLREEHAVVERRPVDRPIGPGDEAMMRDQAIEVEETSEEPVISKRARVKEEIVVGKEAKERTEKVQDTVRHTEVKVERGGENLPPREAARTAERTRTTAPPVSARPGTVPTSLEESFRRDYDHHYAPIGIPFEQILPAYQFGAERANDPDFQGKSWSDAASKLQKEYNKLKPPIAWEDAKAAISHGWNVASEPAARERK